MPNFELCPILNIPEVTFINLQYIDFANDLNKLKEDLGIIVHNFDDLDHYDNIDDVAALCSALDVIVSTKTTVPIISAGLELQQYLQIGSKVLGIIFYLTLKVRLLKFMREIPKKLGKDF